MMTEFRRSKRGKGGSRSDDPIAAYAEAQSPPYREICNALRGLIDKGLTKPTSKVWHGSPAWFIDDNPVAGFSATAQGVNLLFWNGRAFDEPVLKPVGKYQPAQAAFTAAADIDPPGDSPLAAEGQNRRFRLESVL